jgi:hypothetical protein
MSHHISPLTGEVVKTGQTLELRSSVFTMDGLTAKELARDYEKDCTLEFDGRVIGWSHYAGMVRFVKRIEEQNTDHEITNVTYWGNKQCLYHKKLLYSMGGFDADDLLDGPRDNEIWENKKDKEGYLSRNFGSILGKTKNIYTIHNGTK